MEARVSVSFLHEVPGVAVVPAGHSHAWAEPGVLVGREYGAERGWELQRELTRGERARARQESS